jgi:hypothetical protein
LLTFDFETISELATFVIKKNKTYAADEGKHDDMVSTLLLFAWLTTQQYFKDLTNVDPRNKLYEGEQAQIDAEIPLPPMITTADPGPKRFKENGIIWEEVNQGDDWSGYSSFQQHIY